MKQHLNSKSFPHGAAFVPLEKLMCWKETRNKKEKGQKEMGKGVAGGKKKHEQALDTAKPRMY